MSAEATASQEAPIQDQTLVPEGQVKTTAITMPETTTDAEDGKLIIPQAKKIIVTNQEQYEAAIGFMRFCKGRISAIDTKMKESIDLAFKLHRNLTTTRGELKAPYEEAHAIAERQASTWWREQQRLKQLAEDKARKEAQERADAERREKERLLEEERLRTAQDLHDSGRKEEAEAVLEVPVYVPPVPVSVAAVAAVTPGAQKVKGSAVKEKWVPEYYDDNLIPRKYLMRDEKKIKDVISALGPEADIPGVRAVLETKVQARKIGNG